MKYLFMLIFFIQFLNFAPDINLLTECVLSLEFHIFIFLLLQIKLKTMKYILFIYIFEAQKKAQNKYKFNSRSKIHASFRGRIFASCPVSRLMADSAA